MSRWNCEETVGRISDFLDSDLTAEELGFFDEHMDACPPCKAELSAYQKMGDLCRDFAPVTPTADIWSAIATRLPRQKARTLWPKVKAPRFAWLGGGALAAGFAAAFAWFYLAGPGAGPGASTNLAAEAGLNKGNFEQRHLYLTGGNSGSSEFYQLAGY